jgi:hypothetical protein
MSTSSIGAVAGIFGDQQRLAQGPAAAQSSQTSRPIHPLRDLVAPEFADRGERDSINVYVDRRGPRLSPWCPSGYRFDLAGTGVPLEDTHNRPGNQ